MKLQTFQEDFYHSLELGKNKSDKYATVAVFVKFKVRGHTGYAWINGIAKYKLHEPLHGANTVVTFYDKYNESKWVTPVHDVLTTVHGEVLWKSSKVK